MILTELPCGITHRFEYLGDRRVLLLQADVNPRHPDLTHPGSVHTLTGDERRPSRSATLLAVRVGEKHSLVGDPVDVGREVAHHAAAVAAEVRDADVVAPYDENVRLLVGHFL